MADTEVRTDSWINRCRSFAEGVVVMVSPVLLAFALTKVNLTLKEHGRALPIIMLAVAALTLITGIGPFLAFSLSKFWHTPNQMPEPQAPGIAPIPPPPPGMPQPQPPHMQRSPVTLTKWLAPICSVCLVGLACWFMSLIIYNKSKVLYAVPGALIGVCIIIRSVMYCRQDHVVQQENQRYYRTLENSLECLAGITAFLFLGLESLALESYVSCNEKAQRRLTLPIAASFYACVVGMPLMFLAMIPPLWRRISIVIAVFDIVLGVAVFVVMFSMMFALTEKRAFIVMVPGLLIFFAYVLYVAISNYNEAQAQTNLGAPAPAPPVANQDQDEPPASLELTKVTFVGFLAVSIPSISNDSIDMWTECFIHLAAATILSGVIWRLFTHLKSANGTKTAVNVASIATHVCIVIAVIPFSIMAGKALPGTASAPAPAPSLCQT